MNDVRAISTYAPYVDAMFIDNECATFLAEKPLSTDLTFKARIFSLNTGDMFLKYLGGLGRRATDEVRRYVQQIYGHSTQ